MCKTEKVQIRHFRFRPLKLELIHNHSADLDVDGDIESTRLIVQRKDVNGAWDQPSVYLRTVGSQPPTGNDFGVILSNSDIAIHAGLVYMITPTHLTF